MKNFIAACLLLLTLVLTACSGLSRPSTPVLMQTAAPAPTSTSLPPTETPDFVSEPAPEAEPASEWNGIPIMPGAAAGEGDEESYVFIIRATPPQVQEFYRLELGRRGWWLLAREDENTASSTLMFTNNASEMLTVSIKMKRDEALVLLVK